MARSSIVDNRRLLDQQLAKIEEMSNSFVLVGFQEGSVTKSQVKGNRRKSAGKSMPTIAAENEFGTKYIPARPFMRTSFDENRGLIQEFIDNEYEKVLGDASTVKRSLNAIGIFAVGLIQQKIRAIHQPPNSPRTIARKKSSKPLIDFGQMIQSVRHKVVKP